MARWENTGIYETYYPETLDELFLHGDYDGIPNFVVEIARCERRARQIFDGQEGTSPKKVIVRFEDNSNRPLSEAQKRDENGETLEKIMALDVRNSPVALDARNLLLAADNFHRTWEQYHGDLKQIDVSESAIERARLIKGVERMCLLLLSLAMKIAALDKRIATRPFERDTLSGRKFSAANAASLEERKPQIEERKVTFLKLYDDSKGKSKLQRIEAARKAFTELFKRYNHHCEDERDKVKTPSVSKAYKWLEQRALMPST